MPTAALRFPLFRCLGARSGAPALLLGGVLLLPALGWSQTVPEAPTRTAGRPTLVLPDGGRYYGALRNGRLHGQGRIEWGASRYEGAFLHGRMHGKGRQVGSDYVYEGDFAHGEMHGRGRMQYENGSFYEGQFQHDRMDGEARIGLDGTVFEGRARQGQPAGQGRLTLPSGVVVEGVFEGYAPQGQAVLRWPDGSRYEGPLQGLEPEGRGTLTLADGRVIRGEFEFGTLEGEAEVRHPDGSVYTGTLVGQRPEGRGELRLANGDVFTGRFLRGLRDGLGRLQFASGAEPQVGHWRNDRYIGTEGDGTLELTPELVARNNETLLYHQPALLARELAALKPREGDAPQMYALLIAGDGTQEVFRREVAFVDELLARRYGTQGRAVRLVNSRSSVDRLPLATPHSIEQALAALAKVMDRERDLLFVFMTSHGSPTHEFQLSMNELTLPMLPAARLGQLLQASGIRQQVVVVSACYSGGFIEPLRSDTRWIITAARADRTSFGCADENDFTYFGRALFKESLPDAPDLSTAVARAGQLVQQWEDRDAAAEKAGVRTASPEAALQRSEPQSDVTPAFRAQVDQWFAARAGRATASNAASAATAATR